MFICIKFEVLAEQLETFVLIPELDLLRDADLDPLFTVALEELLDFDPLNAATNIFRHLLKSLELAVLIERFANVAGCYAVKFFDDVMVMTDDLKLRQARLFLMKALEFQILRLADVSEIVPEADKQE